MHVSSLHSILPDGESAPEWVKLVPGGTFSGEDGRGPYVLDNAEAVIAASMRPGKHLVFDQDHATAHSLKSGVPAPARGWITELQARDGSIWGRVKWTDEGKRLLVSREYRGVSPEFSYDPASMRITRVLSASLTNAPNLDLPSLHSQEPRMDLLPAIRTALGLPETADAAAAIAAASAAHQAVAAHAQQLAAIAGAAKLDARSDASAIATALQARGAGAGTLEEVTALQSRIVELETADRRRSAEAAIDAAMRAGKPILAGRREEFVARHMQDAKGTEAWLADMPSLRSGGVGPGPAPEPGSGLDHADGQVVALMGLSQDAFRRIKEAVAKGVAA